MKVEAFPAHVTWQLELLLLKMVEAEGVKEEDQEQTIETLERLPLMDTTQGNAIRLDIMYRQKWTHQNLVDTLMADTYMEKAGEVQLEDDERFVMACRDSLEDTAGEKSPIRIDHLLETMENL
jgi:hypothetical protein